MIGKIKNHLILAIGVISWGTSGFIGKILINKYLLQPLTVAAYRIVITSLIFSFINLFNYRKYKTVKVEHLYILIPYALSIFGYQFFYFGGVAIGNVAIVTVISLACTPFFILIYEITILNKKITAIDIFLIISCIISILSISLTNKYDLNLLSIVYSIIASIMFAIMITLSKELQKDYDDIVIASNAFLITSLFLFRYITKFYLNLSFIFLVVSLSLVSGVIGFLCYLKGSKKLDLILASLYSLLEPLTAIFLSVIFLNEKLINQQIFGIILLLISLFIFSIKGINE